ncbi:MAG: tRNA (adenosine(37)-N6)-dimethylallyltransferase MiaA [Planctomycetota bacterium]
MSETLYFIMGCTAGGKGALGRELARRLGGQIISVDSMKVYRRMDIGTAKPLAEARREIPHWCVDVVEPWQKFSVAEFVSCADDAIARIRQAGDLPLAVGGTSLYIKALSEGLFQGPAAQPELRRGLRERAEREGLHTLHAELAAVDPEAGDRIHPNDEKRIVRALEVYHSTGRPISELQKQWDNQPRRYDCVLIGLRREKPDRNHRINMRVKRMVQDGLVEEARALWEDPRGIAPQAAQAVGYAELFAHFRGEMSLDDAIERVKINTRQLAKKQRTWQRRFRGVTWFDLAPDDTAQTVADRVMQRLDLPVQP